jgi:O-antigen/teichoic acid export membrane protein
MFNRLAMAGSVLIRMGAGLVAFILIARGLGPEAYGLVATVFAYATLVSLVTDFGFGSKALRDIAAEPERGGAILNACLNLKAVLTLAAMVIGGIAIWLAPKPPGTGLPMAMLGAAVLIGAIGDLALTAYRATGKYRSELWLTAWTAALHVAVVGWVALSHAGLPILGIAFLASRSFYAVLAVVGAERLFAGYRLSVQPLVHVWTSMKSAWSWGVDNMLGYLNVQIDSLLVASLFSLHLAGIYQGGNRFVQAGFAVVIALAAIHIPRITREIKDGGPRLSRPELLMNLEFTAIGVLGAIGLAFVAPPVTLFLLGEDYAQMGPLWPGFAVFFLARAIAAGIGVSLVSIGVPIWRIVGQVLGLSVTFCAILLVRRYWGINGVPWALAAGAATTLTIYGLVRLNYARGAGLFGTTGVRSADT